MPHRLRSPTSSSLLHPLRRSRCKHHLPHSPTTEATSDYLPPATSTTTPSNSDGDSVLTCLHCDRTFTLHLGLVGHLRIHRTETGELVPGAPAPPPMPSLPPCIHSSHGPARSHAHPQKWNPPRCQHI
ncbi:unnamed protein product [Schistocephalus solidus]|uniref:C2H2-type domain-containing protein n=1 Tax=Schistocephalus solidus TaxID=70667 RepID=A0A183T0C1_SCHSO|nr:unnamed protein product [Schistocephalus solidus]